MRMLMDALALLRYRFRRWRQRREKIREGTYNHIYPMW